MIHSGEMDNKYQLVTLSFDGTHNLIRKLDNFDKGYSYKLKDWAYNILAFENYYLLNLLASIMH